MNPLNRHRPSFAPLSYALILLGVCLGIFSGCTKEGPSGPAGPAGDQDLMNPAIQPQVIATVPSNGSTGPYALYTPADWTQKPHFVIQFNKLIDLIELLNNPNTVTIQGFDRRIVVRPFDMFRIPKTRKKPQDWPYDNVVEFRLEDPERYLSYFYQIGQTYSVTIDTSLVDINGNHLQAPFQFSYIPEPYFRTVHFFPADGSRDISREQMPWIYFNSPVDTQIFSSLHITPTVTGFWSLNSPDSNAVTYRPFGVLDYNTSYTVSVDGTGRDKAGHLIHAPDSATFTTIAFRVTSTYPSNGSTGVELTAPVSFSLSGMMDTASARLAFSISPPTSGDLYIGPWGIGFTPFIGWIPATDYTITLSTALRSKEGTHHIAEPYHLRFQTDRFRVSSTYPANGAYDVDLYQTVTINMNAPIDTSSVRSALHVSPSIPVSLWINNYQVSFYPLSPFAPYTTYTVTLDSTVRTFGGYPMGIPYSFYFRTRE